MILRYNLGPVLVHFSSWLGMGLGKRNCPTHMVRWKCCKLVKKEEKLPNIYSAPFTGEIAQHNLPSGNSGIGA